MNRTRNLLAIPTLAVLFLLGLPALASGFPEVQQGYDLIAPAKQETPAAAPEKSQPRQVKVEKPSGAATLPFMNQQAPDLPFLNRPPADLPFLKNQAPVADLPFLKQKQVAPVVQQRVEPTIQHDPVIENSIFQENIISGRPTENDKISAELTAASQQKKLNQAKTRMGQVVPGSRLGFDGLDDSPSGRLAPVGGADTSADAAPNF
jgi:hypothetical protein